MFPSRRDLFSDIQQTENIQSPGARDSVTVMVNCLWSNLARGWVPNLLQKSLAWDGRRHLILQHDMKFHPINRGTVSLQCWKNQAVSKGWCVTELLISTKHWFLYAVFQNIPGETYWNKELHSRLVVSISALSDFMPFCIPLHIAKIQNIRVAWLQKKK